MCGRVGVPADLPLLRRSQREQSLLDSDATARNATARNAGSSDTAGSYDNAGSAHAGSSDTGS